MHKEDLVSDHRKFYTLSPIQEKNRQYNQVRKKLIGTRDNNPAALGLSMVRQESH
jgi:hypothetical protein